MTVYDQAGIRIVNGECGAMMQAMDPNSIDALVTDPPYALSFMSKAWDAVMPGVDIWRECLRLAKPGAHLLAFGGTRTFHRLACAIEDAGWEIRDTMMWVYGSGFPKSLDVSKAIDKAAGAEREVIGRNPAWRKSYAKARENGQVLDNRGPGEEFTTAPTTDAAQHWSGWGTALKPAYEPILICRKPLDGTVAQNVLKWGVGALNIDGCRVPLDGDYKCKANGRPSQTGLSDNYDPMKANKSDTVGRWPANFIHDGSQEVLELFPDSNSNDKRGNPGGQRSEGFFNVGSDAGESKPNGQTYDDGGSAARFFYTAKASGSDRGNEEWDALPLFAEPAGSFRNGHPTVKPLALMRYLLTLVSRDDQLILDPFCGSGTTLVAAQQLGRKAIGIEREQEYCHLAVRRL